MDRKVDVVLSDMAPNATGVKDLDAENIIALCYSVFRFAVTNSIIGGTLLMKLWECGQIDKLESDLKRFYEKVKRVKPNASRMDSAEIFILSRSFKGLKIS